MMQLRDQIVARYVSVCLSVCLTICVCPSVYLSVTFMHCECYVFKVVKVWLKFSLLTSSRLCTPSGACQK